MIIFASAVESASPAEFVDQDLKFAAKNQSAGETPLNLDDAKDHSEKDTISANEVRRFPAIDECLEIPASSQLLLLAMTQNFLLDGEKFHQTE